MHSHYSRVIMSIYLFINIINHQIRLNVGIFSYENISAFHKMRVSYVITDKLLFMPTKWLNYTTLCWKWYELRFPIVMILGVNLMWHEIRNRVV